MPTGVPQGSCLYPALFNSDIKDLPKTDQTKIALFVDDTTIYVESGYQRIAAKKIQDHLDLLTDYNRMWKIKVNADKSILLTIGKTDQHRQYTMKTH